MPADEGLHKVQEYLATSGMGAFALRFCLETVGQLFDVCVVDSPPQRTQICLSVVGASDRVLIPAEALNQRSQLPAAQPGTAGGNAPDASLFGAGAGGAAVSGPLVWPVPGDG